MAEFNQSESITKTPKPKGGKRPGAGRKPMQIEIARRLDYATNKHTRTYSAESILFAINDRKEWVNIYKGAAKQEDWRTCLQILVYLTDRRDGKAPQSINLTALNVQLTSGDIEKARNLARSLIPELKGEVVSENRPAGSVRTASAAEDDTPKLGSVEYDTPHGQGKA